MRLPSNGIGFDCGFSRGSLITFGIAASRVPLSGHSIHEKTTARRLPHGVVSQLAVFHIISQHPGRVLRAMLRKAESPSWHAR